MTDNRSHGGEAAANNAPSAAGLAKLLKGLDFPANKSKIVQHARQNRNNVADPDQVINALDNLPDREYNGPVDVEEQFGKEK